MISGTRSPISSKSVSTAKIAALALSVSKMVSIEEEVGAAVDQAARRLPVGVDELLPGDAARARVVDVRAQIEAVRLVGPSEPATKRGAPGRGGFGGVGGVAGQRGGRDVDLPDDRRVEP